MAASRRDRLAEVIGESSEELPGADTGADTGNQVGKGADTPETGFPFAVLSGSGVDNPSFETRVKTPDKAKDPKRELPKRAGTASERQLQEISEALTEKIDTISAMTAGVVPVTSVYLAEYSPKAIAALVNIGKRRPAMLKVLSKAADGIDALELAKFVVGILTALQVDFGRLTGDEIPARITGVTALLDEHFRDQGEKPNPAVMFQAPAYVPV